MKTNIVLIGFMGTGKTAVGKRLAVLLHREFYDSDREVEKVTGMTIPELFNKYGEVRFASEENLAISRLAQRDNCVIATGGSFALDVKNMELLAQKGLIICLSARPEIIFERVKRRNNRPVLKKGDMYKNIEDLLQKREDLYKRADLYIDTSDLDFQGIIDRIMEFIGEKMKQVIL